MEESFNEKPFFDFISCGPTQNTTESSDGKCSEIIKEIRQQKRSKEAELLLWLQQFPAAPISNIFKSNEYFKSKFIFWNFKKFRNSQILKIFNKQFLTMSIKEIYEYALSVKPIFNAPNGNVTDYYYDIEISTVWLEKILYHNYETFDNIKTFLINLILILDRVKPKVNTLMIVSPPNGGKNLFFDSILHLCFSFGQIGNFSKYCNFPLMECVDKRVLLWNEPQCDVNSFETLKMLFGGDTCNVKVKYEQDTILSRTPIIVLLVYDL